MAGRPLLDPSPLRLRLPVERVQCPGHPWTFGALVPGTRSQGSVKPWLWSNGGGVVEWINSGLIGGLIGGLKVNEP